MRSLRKKPYSCLSGSLTFTTISAPHASAALGTIVAPCATYSASLMPLPSPAPFSTSTLWPRDVRLRTPAGVIPTRYSRVLISLGTPMITALLLGPGGGEAVRVLAGWGAHDSRHGAACLPALYDASRHGRAPARHLLGLRRCGSVAQLGAHAT